MTINELIAELQRRATMYGSHREVVVTWEGVFRELDLSNIYLDKEGRLLIDADGNFYKDRFQHPEDVASNPPATPE